MFVLMNCFIFVFPVSAAPPVIYPKLNIKVSKTLDDNATAILKEAGTGSVSTWNSLHEFKNSDDAYRTFGGDSTSLVLFVGMDTSNYFYHVRIDEYYRDYSTNSLTLTNTWNCYSSSYEIFFKENCYYEVTIVRGNPMIENGYCVSNPEIIFYPEKIVDVSEYSSVFDDLQKDARFKISDYPSIADDYSLDVIQIAESVDGDLFVYVYNPSDATVEVEAAKINMSLQHYEDRSASYQLYDLTLVSTSGTLDKYVVNDFTVSDDDYRYYNIAAVYTPYNEDVHDSAQQDDDVINYVASSVGKCYAAHIIDETLVYKCVKVDVVDIDIKAVGSIRYSEGIKSLGIDATDSHYVAFSIENYDVKRIFDATITYTLYDHSYSLGLGLDGTPTLSNYRTITDDIYEWERGNVDGSWLFGYDYSWKRIQTIKEFNQMLQDNTNEYINVNEEQLNDSEYVFLFTETDYSVVGGSSSGTTSYFSTRVENVAILRLHFATPTSTYNLGVVSNVISDDGNPDFEVGTDDNIQNWGEDNFGDLEILLFIIVLIVGVIGLSYVVPFIKTMFNGIVDAISFLIQLLVSLITLPFELLASIFGGDKPGKKRGKRK